MLRAHAMQVGTTNARVPACCYAPRFASVPLARGRDAGEDQIYICNIYIKNMQYSE
jgi:hypothetical protein